MDILKTVGLPQTNSDVINKVVEHYLTTLH